MKKAVNLLIFSFIFLAFFSNLAFPNSKSVSILKIEDHIINPIVTEYIQGGISKSKEMGAEAVIIKLDTPGGLLSSTRDIVKEFLKDEIPVIVYVSPKGARAASAGTFITLAANVAAMAPSTNIGAAHPVSMGGGGSFKKKVKKELKQISEEKKESNKNNTTVMSEKVLNDTIAWAKNITNIRNRNSNWAVKSIKESSSLTADEALERNVIDLKAATLDKLLHKIDGRKITLGEKKITLDTKRVEKKEFSMSIRQKVLNAISHPNIAYILLMLGFYGLLFEITHPGFGVPGIGGIISLLLAFYSFQVLPINFAGLGLIVLAVILFVAEAFTPTFGLLTMGGALSMFLGSLILIDSPYEFMQVSLKIVLPIIIASGGIGLFLVGNVLKTRRYKISSGKEGLIGEEGRVKTKITSESGKVFVHGERWDAVTSKGEVIPEGEKIKVVKVEGLRLVIKRHG